MRRMKAAVALIALMLALIYAVLRAMDADARADAATERTAIWQAKYAEAATNSDTVIDTVRSVVTRWKTRVDSLPGDTVTITKTELDTVFAACLLCAEQFRAFRITADSTIYSLRQELNLATNREKFWKRCGAYAGYGISGGSDNAVRHGVQIGLGCRAWP